LLIESLEPAPESEVEAAWPEEIARRMTELHAGTVETILWEEVHAELFGRRNERQIPSGGS
jgi:putative addiction module component (TIGR02574 family)